MASYPGRVTAQGQVSVPAEFRREMGFEPGADIQWTRDGDRLVFERRKLYTTKDIQNFIRETGGVKHLTDEQIEQRAAVALMEKYGKR